jgi:hypothetical protein
MYKLRRPVEEGGPSPRPFPAATIGHGVSAGHRLDDLTANLPAPNTPSGYTQGAPNPRFRRSDALLRTGWQVKDSNLRSFRDGLTARHMPTDLRIYGWAADFAANSPQTLDGNRSRSTSLEHHVEITSFERHGKWNPAVRAGMATRTAGA